MWSYKTCSDDLDCQTKIQKISETHERRVAESFYSGLFAYNETTKTLLSALCFFSALGYGSMFLMIY